MNIEAYVPLFYIVAKHGTPKHVRKVLENARVAFGDTADQIFQVVALEVTEWFAKQGKLSELYRFSETLRELGIDSVAHIGFQEVRSNTSNVDLQNLAVTSSEAVRTAHSNFGLPDWYYTDPTFSQSRYRGLENDSQYQCFRFNSHVISKEGTLEIISLNRIHQAGFLNTEEWRAYLENLHSQGHIELIEVGQYNDENASLFCFYEIPRGMKTLADCLVQDNAAELLSPTAVLNLAYDIVEILIQAKHDEFQITSLDPLNVLWNPLGSPQRIKLLNIGASLGFPRYQCSVSNCNVSMSPSPSESGNALVSYYLGLLLLQLLKCECPIKEIGTTGSRYSKKKSLSEILEIPDLSPQFRSVLGRMLNNVAEYRYTDLSWLRSDLEEIINYVRDLQALQSGNNSFAPEFFTLYHFANFRLQVISRNPENNKIPPAWKVSNMLTSLSSDLGYLPKELLNFWHNDAAIGGLLSMFPKKRKARHISPKGKRLLDIAKGWEALILRHDRPEQISPLSKLCLYQILIIEAASTLSSIVKANTDISSTVYEGINSCVLDLAQTVQNQTHLDFELQVFTSSDAPPIEMAVSLGIIELEQLKEYVSWISVENKAKYDPKPASLSAIMIFLLLFNFETKILRNNSVITSSSPLPNSSQTKIRRDSIWKFVKYCEHIEEAIKNFNSNLAGEMLGENSEHWRFVFDIVDTLHRLSLSKRIPAQIHYSKLNYRANEGSGFAELIFPRHGQLSFRSDAYFSGYVKTTDKRPARVDIIGGHAEQKITSVHAPTRLFSKLPYPQRKISPRKVAMWMKNNKVLVILFSILIIFGLITSVEKIVEVHTNIVIPDFIKWGISLFGIVAPDLWAGALYGFLEAIYPEDVT